MSRLVLLLLLAGVAHADSIEILGQSTGGARALPAGERLEFTLAAAVGPGIEIGRAFTQVRPDEAGSARLDVTIEVTRFQPQRRHYRMWADPATGKLRRVEMQRTGLDGSPLASWVDEYDHASGVVTRREPGKPDAPHPYPGGTITHALWLPFYLRMEPGELPGRRETFAIVDDPRGPVALAFASREERAAVAGRTDDGRIRMRLAAAGSHEPHEVVIAGLFKAPIRLTLRR
jgi:hypothetical protein